MAIDICVEDLMFIPNLPADPLVGAEARREEHQARRSRRRK